MKLMRMLLLVQVSSYKISLMRKIILLLIIILPIGIFCQIHVINDSLIIRLNKSLEKIDTSDIDNASVNDIKLDEIEVPLNKITYSIESGKVKTNDYKSYEINKLEKKVNLYRTIINKQISSLDLLYYNKGTEEIKIKDYESGIKYFEKSIEFNPLYIPSLYKLSLILTEESDLKKASELITIILNKTYPGASDYNLILNLAKNIYDDFIKKSDDLKLHENYNAADEELQRAKHFCISNPAINCKEKIEKEIVSAKYGIYKSFLSIAESAVNTRHYDMAENFIFSAMDYRKKNEQYLKENNEAENLAEFVIDRYMTNAAKYINSHKFEKALECFGRASNLCDSIKDVICNDKIKNGINSIKNNVYEEFVTTARDLMKKGQTDIAEDFLDKAKSYRNSNKNEISDSSFADIILKNIKYSEYKRLIHAGKDYIKNDNLNYAFKSLDIADKLERKYGLEKDKNKDSLIKKAAKPAIIEKLKSCEIKIWGNELEAAEKIVRCSDGMQVKYFLKNDIEINHIMNDIKQKILNRKCSNDQDAYDLLIFKAKECIQKLDYIEAIKIYNDAVAMVYKHTECNLYVVKAYETKNRYQIPANYQMLKEEADNQYEKKDYYHFLKSYDAAESYYSLANINDYGLKHIALYDLILNKDEYKLIIAGIQFYIDNSQHNNALNLLKYLKSKNYSSELTKNLQEKLAVSLAKNDNVIKNKNRAKENISTYTADSKWFKYFNKKYKRELTN
jgi:tetratricopeptide (TPR) repeat protein